ncbi:MAG: flagellar hook capping FlgD N-terminal domain-containing protein, partial [Pseudomonadota bacterium]
MTEIAPVGAATGSTSGSVAAQAASEGAETVSDFDDFLTLLTAQLENQDPLSPLDATTFVEQLASFSEVEQAVATNQKLDEIMAQVFNAGLDQAAAWIGRSVQASGLDFQFDGSELTIDVPTEPNATSASVVLRDKDGREVATLPASVDGGEVTWDGTKADGSKAAAGSSATSSSRPTTGSAAAASPNRGSSFR